MKKFFMILCLIMPVLLTAQRNINKHIPYDKKLAAKYDLNIPEPSDQLKPAPVWLQNLDMIFADWTVTADMQNTPYKLWKGYRIE